MINCDDDIDGDDKGDDGGVDNGSMVTGGGDDHESLSR